MHLIAACSDCRRQYRVEGCAPGRKMRCACGGLVTVPSEVRGLDARVVRCSSCGAPREKSAASCGACGSDFTLHERDLHTVCPECLARIGDHAKFCHHCGIGIAPEPFSAGTGTKMLCPACSAEPAPRLIAREVGSESRVPFFECPACAGVWLNREIFAELIGKCREAGEAASAAWLFPKTHVLGESDGTKATAARFYRKCPTCSEVMARRNFADVSGVIVDACAAHGAWFDCNELAAILKWVREGGMERSAGARRLAGNPAAGQRRSDEPTARVYGRPEKGFLGMLAEALFHEFTGDLD